MFASGSTPSLKHAGDSDEETDFFAIYPNPATEQVYLNLTSPRAQTVNIRLLDATGRMVRWVYTGQDVQTLQLPIAVGDLADGLYLLEVRTDSGLQTARVLVRH